MADKTSLQLIGFTLAALAVATILLAGIVVQRTMTVDIDNGVRVVKMS